MQTPQITSNHQGLRLDPRLNKVFRPSELENDFWIGLQITSGFLNKDGSVSEIGEKHLQQLLAANQGN
ncbi:MAG: hypothetical protein HY276_05765 [Ignavibacteriales bacterium]|nr:hypothetical protein [Ignavibacteriales bacterium]